MSKALKHSKPGTEEKKARHNKRARPQLKKSELLQSSTLDEARHQESSILETDDRESYLRLRQSLDSFSARAIHYYASGANTPDRTERQRKVKLYVDSFLHAVLLSSDSGIDCPPGTRECPGGDCVPVYLPCIH
jgi:hypothetical protein